MYTLKKKKKKKKKIPYFAKDIYIYEKVLYHKWSPTGCKDQN